MGTIDIQLTHIHSLLNIKFINLFGMNRLALLMKLLLLKKE